jgi:type III pantothenate kinase
MSKEVSLPCVAVSIGNTSMHLGWFDAAGDPLPEPTRVLDLSTESPDLEQLAAWLAGEAGPVYVASVHRPAERQLHDWCQRRDPPSTYRKLAHTDLPLEINVDHPDRVGMDRLVAAVAANRLRDASRPAIVIDAGTALTVDAISREGAFLGGAILPGIQMSARALATQTDQLPLVPVDPDQPPAAIGKNTQAAIQSGLYWGTVGALRELIRGISADLLGPPELFVTGGDAAKLAERLEPRARLVPHLVISGVALVAQHLARQSVS